MLKSQSIKLFIRVGGYNEKKKSQALELGISCSNISCRIVYCIMWASHLALVKHSFLTNDMGKKMSTL